MIWQTLQRVVTSAHAVMAELGPVPNGLLNGVDPNDPNNGGLNAVTALIHNAIAIALYAAGALSVIFITIGGLRYVLSAGNPAAVKSAKDTIMYAIIGLIVTLSTWAILAFATNIF